MARARSILALALAAAAGLASSAPAQIAPSRSGTSSMSYLGQGEVWDAIGEFGVCYAGTNRKGALSLIATETNSDAETATYRKLFGKGNPCLGDVVGLHGIAISMIRGAVAEGLYRKGVAVPAELMQTAPSPGQIHNLGQAALCYTAAHPDKAQALIATTHPGSRKEYEAMTALAADFWHCIPAGARNVDFDSTQIRFRIAEALLRTGHLPPAAER
jgi:hypothetical protein